VIDGDTFKVNIPNMPAVFGHDLSIRIAGIDTAPIRYQKCLNEAKWGEAARDELRRILNEAKIIELKNMERGKFFRVVADVYADGANVGDLLMIKGLAMPYDGKGDKPNWCKKAYWGKFETYKDSLDSNRGQFVHSSTVESLLSERDGEFEELWKVWWVVEGKVWWVYATEESLTNCRGEEESLRGSPNRLEESLALVTEAVQLDWRKVWMKRNQGKFGRGVWSLDKGKFALSKAVNEESLVS